MFIFVDDAARTTRQGRCCLDVVLPVARERGEGGADISSKRFVAILENHGDTQELENLIRVSLSCNQIPLTTQPKQRNRFVAKLLAKVDEKEASRLLSAAPPLLHCASLGNLF